MVKLEQGIMEYVGIAKGILRSLKPRNYRFIKCIAIYVLAIAGSGMALIDDQFMRSWGLSLVDSLYTVFFFVFSVIVVLAFGGILIRKEEFLLSPIMQWYLLGIIEVVILGGMVIIPSGKFLLKNGTSLEFTYVWTSLIPVLFAGIHMGCKFGYGYRPNEMPRELYQKLQSYFDKPFGISLSCLISFILSLVGKFQCGGNAAYVNYLISFFFIMILNGMILKYFYRPVEVSKEDR